MGDGAQTTPTLATRGTGAVLQLPRANLRTSLADERSARNTRPTMLRRSHQRIVRVEVGPLSGSESTT
jgi:hypothetical protein